MEHENPKYLLYFDLASYQENEFITIKKLVKNIFNVRYYFLDIDIQFNEEIINYEAIRKDLSNNVMLLIGQIDDNLADDIVYEINTLLGTDKVIRRRSIHDFNCTGYSDEQLNAMYHEFLDKSEKLADLSPMECEDLQALSQDFSYINLPYLKEENYLAFCQLLINNASNLDSFEMLQDSNVCEALFKHFTYFLKYLSKLSFYDLIIYYNKDIIKILRNIRSFVKDSETSNDNIKELLLYKYILQRFKINQFFYDPEEGFNQIRAEIEKVIEERKKVVIDAFIKRVPLFKENYEIINISDNETKTHQAYKMISANLKKHFETLKPLLKSFRETFESPVKFNSKQHNPERNKITLDRLKKCRIVKDYHEKYGNYTINIESNEHIPFLQGKWFEYYTASVCEEIIENYRSQGYYPDYGIYQNVLVQINGVKRELDVIVYLNGTIFYIENKIDSKNTYKNDILKYGVNVEYMNVNPHNCMLVYLEGEDRLTDKIKICNFNTFVTRFKKEALRVLEEDKVKYLAILKEKERVLKLEHSIAKTLEKEKRSLYLKYHYDDSDESKFLRLLDKYREETIKLVNLSKFNFFDDLEKAIKNTNDDKLINSYNDYKDKFKTLYLKAIRKDVIDIQLIQSMIDDLDRFNYSVVEVFIEYLLCLDNDLETFFAVGNQDLNTKLKILCAYGNNNPNYLLVIGSFLTSQMLLTASDSHYLIIAYLNSINKKVLNPIHIDEFIRLINIYMENSQIIIKREIKSSRDAYIITRKEKEFISVLVFTIGMIHFNSFNIQGLKIENTEEFLCRLSANPEKYHLYLQNEKIGNKLLKYQLKKQHFHEGLYIDLASYLLLNYKVLKTEVEKMLHSDDELMFTVLRTEQVSKMLKKLEGSGIVAGFKEIKIANLYIGIFKNKETYDWFKNYCWVGVGLAFSYECDFNYTNAFLTYNNEEIKIMFVYENKQLTMCLGKVINEELKLALVTTNYQNLSKTIENLNDDDFIYQLDNIKNECDKIFKKEGIINE